MEMISLIISLLGILIDAICFIFETDMNKRIFNIIEFLVLILNLIIYLNSSQRPPNVTGGDRKSKLFFWISFINYIIILLFLVFFDHPNTQIPNSITLTSTPTPTLTSTIDISTTTPTLNLTSTPSTPYPCFLNLGWQLLDPYVTDCSYVKNIFGVSGNENNIAIDVLPTFPKQSLNHQLFRKLPESISSLYFDFSIVNLHNEEKKKPNPDLYFGIVEAPINGKYIGEITTSDFFGFRDLIYTEDMCLYGGIDTIIKPEKYISNLRLFNNLCQDRIVNQHVQCSFDRKYENSKYLDYECVVEGTEMRFKRSEVDSSRLYLDVGYYWFSGAKLEASIENIKIK